MTLHEIYEKLKGEHARSLMKHGKWKDLDPDTQRIAIENEVDEFLRAFYREDVHGPHGQIAELIQVMNVAARRIMYLTGEEQ